MALPIKPTPVLKGKDAEMFLKALDENQGKSAPREEVEAGLRMMVDVLKNSSLN